MRRSPRSSTTEDELRRRLKLDRVPERRADEVLLRAALAVPAPDQCRSGERLLVTLRLDDTFHGDLDGYALHPALLDVAGRVRPHRTPRTSTTCRSPTAACGSTHR